MVEITDCFQHVIKHRRKHADASACQYNRKQTCAVTQRRIGLAKIYYRKGEGRGGEGINGYNVLELDLRVPPVAEDRRTCSGERA